MKNKYVFSYLLLLIILLFSGCMAVTSKSSLKLGLMNTYAPNKIFIHKDVLPGDFAILKVNYNRPNFQKKYYEFYLVLRKTESFTVVRHEIHDESEYAYTLFCYHYHIDKEGNVHKAFLVDRKNGDQSPLRIAVKDNPGYLDFKNVKTTNELGKYSRRKMATTFGAFSVMTVAYLLCDKLTIAYLTDKVRFGVLSTITISKDGGSSVNRIIMTTKLIRQGNNY